ncbi:MAG TPA: hypothetical protein VHX38_02515 [Pseudonocardiaceae bacterium]|jgi:hypothetical protein|nr:hypothetical protein [Pseudonocardiaceae bacterium]
MAATSRLPIRMRLGDTAEYEVGHIEIPVTSEGTVHIVRSRLAEVLRAAADLIDTDAT